MAGSDSDFTYDNTVEGICERVTYILGDAEKGYPNQTWEKKFLRAVVCDALWMMSMVDPDLFKAETVRFPLEAENRKQVIDCEACESFLSFVCIETEDGVRIPVTEADYDTILRSAFLPSPCIHCRGGAMGHVASITVAMAPDSSDAFVMSPMSPEGEQLYAVVRCRNIKRFDQEDVELPGELRAYMPMIIQLALYFALGGDRSKGAYAELAQGHFRSFMELANMTRQREIDFFRLQRLADGGN